MGAVAETGAFARSCRAYAELVRAMGCSLDRSVLADHLAADGEDRSALDAALAAALDGEEGPQDLAPGLGERMHGLEEGLTEEIAQAASGLDEDGWDALEADELARRLAEAPQQERRAILSHVLLNGHRQFLHVPMISLAEFREAARQCIDLEECDPDELLPHLRWELRRRGFPLSMGEVEELFDVEGPEREVPACALSILRRADRDLPTGLVELEEMVGEEDPDDWLEAARLKLLFRSHSSMHKAIAEATRLKYDCVHKALSGRKKAKRVQARVKRCMEEWLRQAEAGEPVDAPDEYRAVPVEMAHALLGALERRFSTKEEIYRAISKRTGIKAGSIRRYFQSNGQLKYAPLAVYRCAQKLAKRNGRAAARPTQPQSYLEDVRTRRAASELARRCKEALRRWRGLGDDPDLELAFRELRRELIVTLKEQRQTVTATA